MKKIFLLIILVAGLSASTYAETAYSYNNNHNHNTHNNRHNNNRHNNQNNQTTISKDKLPSSISKYLDKNYPGNTVMISKLREDGYYYIKIKYNQNAYRPYYRSLVFDQNGNLVKG